jgi:hypothetical protein
VLDLAEHPSGVVVGRLSVNFACLAVELVLVDPAGVFRIFEVVA